MKHQQLYRYKIIEPHRIQMTTDSKVVLDRLVKAYRAKRDCVVWTGEDWVGQAWKNGKRWTYSYDPGYL